MTMMATTSPPARSVMWSPLMPLTTAVRITYGGLGLKQTPIIDYRGYVDQPENGNEVHSRFHSFSMRQRLVDANGNFDNQVMLIENGQPPPVGNGLFSDTSPVLSHALTQMDQ